MTARVLAALIAVLSPTEVNLVVTPEPGAAQARLAAALYSGSAEDPPRKEGLAALTAAVVAMDDDGSLPGTHLEVTAGKDLVLIEGSAPVEDAGRLVERLTGVLVAPDLTQERLDRARAAQAARLERLTSDGAALAAELFDRTAFPSHPYAHAVEGTRGSLAGITLEDVRAFHQRHYVKGNLAVAAAGAVDASLTPRLRALLAPLPEGAPARLDRPLTFPSRPRVGVVEVPGAATARLRLGIPLTVPRAHPDHPALVLAADVVRGAAGAGPPGGGCEADSRVQPAFWIDLEAAPEAAVARLVEALDSLAGLARGGGPADPLEAARDLAGRLAASAPAASTGTACPLVDLLHRTPGWSERLPAALEAAAPSWREALARHVPIGRIVVAAAVPDARTFVRDLTSAGSGLPEKGSIELAEDDTEVVALDRLLGE